MARQGCQLIRCPQRGHLGRAIAIAFGGVLVLFLGLPIRAQEKTSDHQVEVTLEVPSPVAQPAAVDTPADEPTDSPDSIEITWRSSNRLSGNIPAGIAFLPPRTPMQWRCQILVSSQHSAKKLELKYSLFRVSNHQRVLSGKRRVDIDAQGNCSPVTINDLSPEAAGIYELRCRLVDTSAGVWDRLRGEESAIATVQQPMMVQRSADRSSAQATHESLFSAQRLLRPVSLNSRPSSTRAAWKTVGTIRPSDPSWRFSQLLPETAARVLPGLHPMRGELKLRDHASKKVCVIDPRSVFQTSLPVLAPGLPHRVSIRFPAGHAQRLRVDIGDGENQEDAVVSLSLPSPLDHAWHHRPWDEKTTDPSARASDTDHRGREWISHSFIYYPSGNDQIWLTNLSDAGRATFESIEVQAGPETLYQPVDQTTGQFSDTASDSPSSSAHDPLNGRFVFNIRSAQWVHLISADWESIGRHSRFSTRTVDWVRTKIATERLADLAKIHGAGAVAIPYDADVDKLHSAIAFFAAENLPVWVVLDQAQATAWKSELSHATNLAGIIIGADSALLEEPELFATFLTDCQQRFQRTAWCIELPADQVTTAFREQVIAAGAKLIPRIEDSSLGTTPANSINNTDDRSDRICLHLAGDWNDSLAQIDSIQTTVLRTQLATARPGIVLIDVDPRCPQTLSDLRDLISAYSKTEGRKLKTIASSDELDQTATLRWASGEDDSYLLITNHAPWDARIQLMIPTDPSLPATTSHDDPQWEPVPPAAWPQWNRDRSESPAEISNGDGWFVKANSILLLRRIKQSDSGSSDWASVSQWHWSSLVEDGQETIDRIKQQVTTVVERIGMLAHPPSANLLRNGSFERTGKVGMFGWLHAQYPPGCVALDSDFSAQGNHSVRMCTDETITRKTWLVSELIPIPRSGRLAVSLACRASPSPDIEMHRMRVSLEGTRGEAPFRETSEIEVPTDGKWQPREIVLRANLNGVTSLDSLRLSIDSLSEGTVWIDHVVLHDNYATEQERSALQNQAFLAVQGLQRGQLTTSARLLSNHWADVLLSIPASGDAPKEKKSTEETVDQDRQSAKETATPSMTQRIRQWLPRPVRF